MKLPKFLRFFRFGSSTRLLQTHEERQKEVMKSFTMYSKHQPCLVCGEWQEYPICKDCKK